MTAASSKAASVGGTLLNINALCNLTIIVVGAPAERWRRLFRFMLEALGKGSPQGPAARQLRILGGWPE